MGCAVVGGRHFPSYTKAIARTGKLLSRVSVITVKTQQHTGRRKWPGILLVDQPIPVPLKKNLKK